MARAAARRAPRGAGRRQGRHDKNAFELALIENVQREDLNADRARRGLDRLIHDHGYTQETLADRIGKDRTTIANVLRLLKLPAALRDRVVAAELSEGHARALLGAGDATLVEPSPRRSSSGGLSVRATEALVRTARQPAAPRRKAGREDADHPRPRAAPHAQARHQGEVRDRGDKGEVVIPYADLDALDRLLDKLL